ncbi:hypothetical protein [Ilumatobacter sp.]|uniref:hypothetical protein n=1 Tax=Ilumatobacter sp. TaxID=1967498 RepID=UPI003B52E395
MAKNDSTARDEPDVSEDDLRTKLRALQSDIQGEVEDRKTTIASVVGGVVVVLAIAMFLLGKRAGKKKSAIVEIRRV